MKITFVLSSFPRAPVGGFRVVYQYANQLVSRGYDVSVIHPRLLSSAPPNNLYQWLRRRVARAQALSFPSKLNWQTLDPRVRMIFVPDLQSKWLPDADVIFATFYQTAEFIAEYPAPKGQKFYLVQDFDPWIASRQRLEATWRLPLKKVAVSRWLYDKVCAAGVPLSEVAYIPNGIDHQRFRILPQTTRPAGTLAMYYGIFKYKAPEDGLEALRQVKLRHKDLTVTLFGHTGARRHKIPSWVLTQPHVSESQLVQIYNQSRIFLCSSLAEGFALPPAEAMACGCAVVSTDCGGIRDFAEHEVTALLSPPGVPEALASNISRLLEDDGLRQRLAAAGHERIQSFTLGRSIDHIEQFIRQEIPK